MGISRQFYDFENVSLDYFRHNILRIYPGCVLLRFVKQLTSSNWRHFIQVAGVVCTKLLTFRTAEKPDGLGFALVIPEARDTSSAEFVQLGNQFPKKTKTNDTNKRCDEQLTHYFM